MRSFLSEEVCLFVLFLGLESKGCVGMEVKRREEKIESFKKNESLMRTVHLTLF